ncbi:MAG: hypothetical protein M1833_002764 [Piccolia ochrophora]|nr:MAG: hypothetical protein M1833_002764 [Piccolia ochrophora]
MEQTPLTKTYQAAQPTSRSPETGAMAQAQPLEHGGASSGISSQSYSRTPIRKTNPPSCNLCRRRKVKCDRADPCSHCTRIGAVCVFSAPSGAPRGRQGGRRKGDSELLDRIAKLENLVKDFEVVLPGGSSAVVTGADEKQTVFEESGPRGSEVHQRKFSPKEPKEGLDRYLGGSLWMNLSDEASVLHRAVFGQMKG